MHTFTIYLAPTPRNAQAGQRSSAGHMWYALSDGSGKPPLVFGLGSKQPRSPYAAEYCGAAGEPDYLDPNIDLPIMKRTMQITKKEFHIIKRFGEDLCE